MIYSSMPNRTEDFDQNGETSSTSDGSSTPEGSDAPSKFKY